MQIEVGGVLVEVEKKPIKNMHLYVVPPNGAVRVSVPEKMSDESIALFVRTRIGWVKKQRLKFQMQARQSVREYVSGETLYVWGRQYFLQVEYSYKGNTLTLSGNKALLTVRRESTAGQRENYVREWYRGLLKENIERYLPKWEQITGLHCSSWQTKYMTTRWGTCNTNSGKIWLNLQLAKKPEECLEYVILHELAHLKVRNHDKSFIAIMDAYMPYWREVRKQLNDSTLDYMKA